LFVSAHPVADTKARLLAAGAELFATRGFAGTKIRDIAARAGANVAAGNYHYGSKKELYLEVLRGQFADVRAQLARRGAAPSAGALARMSRTTLVELLRTRVRIMFEFMVGPPGLEGQLMQREMSDPTEAFPIIVAEFVQPMVDEMSAIVARLAPGLDPDQIQRSVASIAGQVHFYLSAKPVVHRIFGRGVYSPAWVREMVDHVTSFSLAGIERVAPARRRHHAR
jgi:AcrR family transcriptional regulator